MPIVSSKRLDDLYESNRRDLPVNRHLELFRRAEALKKEDRMLLELAFKNSCTVRQLGEIFQLEPGNISRRLRRICARLRDPIATAILDENCELLPEFRQLAIGHFVQGLRFAELAERHQIPLCRVRGIVQFVRVWFKGTRRPTRRLFSQV